MLCELMPQAAAAPSSRARLAGGAFKGTRGQVGWVSQATGAVAWSCRGAGGLSTVWVLVT